MTSPLRTIHQHDSANQGHHPKKSRAHRQQHIRFAEKLAKLLAITDKRSLRESERIAFELGPGKLIFVGGVFYFVS